MLSSNHQQIVSAVNGQAISPPKERDVFSMTDHEIVQLFAWYNFTDEHGHRLDNCQDFKDLIARATRRNPQLITSIESSECSGDARIKDELRSIEAALHDPATTPEVYCQLYAAQQALSWARDPLGTRNPLGVIIDGLVQPLIKDTPAN